MGLGPGLLKLISARKHMETGLVPTWMNPHPLAASSSFGYVAAICVWDSGVQHSALDFVFVNKFRRTFFSSVLSTFLLPRYLVQSGIYCIRAKVCNFESGLNKIFS